MNTNRAAFEANVVRDIRFKKLSFNTCARKYQRSVEEIETIYRKYLHTLMQDAYVAYKDVCVANGWKCISYSEWRSLPMFPY